jgi:predicted transcriptional regulator
VKSIVRVKVGQDEIKHIGTKRHSGRYPWGSGDNPQQRHREFLGTAAKLKRDGLTDVEIAKGMGLRNTTQLRAYNSIAVNAEREALRTKAVQLRETTGMSNVAIGKELGVGESRVRDLLNPAAKERQDILQSTADFLKSKVDSENYIDVGLGSGNTIGVSSEKLATAVEILKVDGYQVHNLRVPGVGGGKETTMQVLVPPGVDYKEFVNNKQRIKPIGGYTEDGGRSFKLIEDPVSINSSRLHVRYDEDGGGKKDGVIELRRGVEDLSLGSARYAQVRIQVDGTHYIKGMAMYSDDMPKGADIIFNTNKSNTGDKLKALKPLKKVEKDGVETDVVDPERPFGSVIRQKHYIDSKTGKMKLSPLNIVGNDENPGSGEEGSWYKWSSNLSSQMLSKQPVPLAKKQLDLFYKGKRDQFDEINALTNPVVKKKLLEKFADETDSAAVKLSAAGLPRTKNHVILPINSLKDTEVYAPQYRDGEKVVLIRHPHGGIFEIPELTVNNKNPDGKRLLGNAKDAVGINAHVAQRLSGADFDGDTVLVIPNAAKGPNRVRVHPALEELKDFDPKISYPKYEGMQVMRNKQQEMGNISNLITDMTIAGAPHSEIARAVRHSMVVIDAEKHELNYKQSAKDNGIAQLKELYQGKSNAGAATLISRASAEVRPGERKPRPFGEGGPIDKNTGAKVFTYSGATYVNRQGKTVQKTTKSKRLAEEADAFALVGKDKTAIEVVYATHANQMKSLANTARLSSLRTPNQKYEPTAAKVYKSEVDSLNFKLNTALQNKPLERKARLLGNATVSAKRQANPSIRGDELKKISGLAIKEARLRVGSQKSQIVITPKEWTAIQAGAISHSKLSQILDNADLDVVKQLATPRDRPVMSDSKIAMAKAMLASGYTQAQVADHLGVPTSTLNSAVE